MRQLLNEESPPEVFIPSDQLFSKYLQDLSPVNFPDNFPIDIDLEPQEPSIATIDPEPSFLFSTVTIIDPEPSPLFSTATIIDPEPSPLVSTATIIDKQSSPSFSIVTSSNHQKPTEQILDVTMTRTITPCTPEDPITIHQDEPLDLFIKLKPANNSNLRPKEIPTSSLTPVINCSVPTNLFYIFVLQ
ncbi:unnamed protein product [Mytilus edulis]|uniref:Uncharacterized protein n=1 Tax=Mytilus edulis TaxID=6550 RepID=A0A8S3RVR3_MYTED|nr:unnamed protein product [Mytilus edulis]